MEVSFCRLECGVHDMLHMYLPHVWDILLPLAGGSNQIASIPSRRANRYATSDLSERRQLRSDSYSGDTLSQNGEK